MKIALVHNRYLWRGGEDSVLKNEAELLADHGHDIVRFELDNQSIETMGHLRVGLGTVWRHSAYRDLRKFFHVEKPDVAHFHNTFPLISPAGYYAARAEHVPVVQTLHNFRLLCANGIFYRDGHPCEACIRRKIAWPALRHKCYRDSRAATGAIALMQTTHRAIGTWRRSVDRYIALTEFARTRFSNGGLPLERIAIKPNFTPDTGSKPITPPASPRFVFVGRLSEEKGIETLINAWKTIPWPIDIYGDGPLLEELRSTGLDTLTVHGAQPANIVAQAMREATALIVPSRWYEGFPMVVVEAYSQGLPIIASKIGALEEVICDGETGCHVELADADDLAEKVNWAAEHKVQMHEMALNARATYERLYSPEVNYRQLHAIYLEAIETAKSAC